MSGKFRKKIEKGFTILELLVVSILMVIVMMIITQFWRWVLPSITEMSARWQILSENRITMQNLSLDFGSAVGFIPVGTDRLVICQDSGEFPNGLADWADPDILVDYSFVDNTLLRSDLSTGMEATVANCISGFEVEQLSPTLIKITLELSCRNIAREMVFFGSLP
jgi:prepilin-type N-terminal cleavage/methylation domain-containing protein